MAEKITYQTVEGDMLDAICHAHYGKTWGVVEQVLNANPGLCEYDVILPAGVKITLPEVDVDTISTSNSNLAFTK